jgi:hypothetical protein
MRKYRFWLYGSLIGNKFINNNESDLIKIEIELGNDLL